MWFKVGARLYGVLTRACNSIAGPPHEHFFFFSFFFRRQVRDGGCARDQLVVARRVLVEYVTNAAFLPYTPRRTTSDDLLGGRGASPLRTSDNIMGPPHPPHHHTTTTTSTHHNHHPPSPHHHHPPPATRHRWHAQQSYLAPYVDTCWTSRTDGSSSCTGHFPAICHPCTTPPAGCFSGSAGGHAVDDRGTARLGQGCS